MAGKSCKEAGALIDVDCYRTGAGMGFLELFRSASGILGSFATLKRLIVDWKPDLLILVDYPDFNLRLARVAKRHGVKVLYYIPPKVWAWRTRRVRVIREVVDHIAAIFPFEPDFYQKHGFSRVTYVGHPLADQLHTVKIPDHRDESILLLPGSRKFEVERLLVPMLRAYEMLRDQGAGVRPVVVLAPNISSDWVKGLLSGKVAESTLDEVTWSHEDALQAMTAAKVAVLKSGTCNLEAALAELPFVCVYSGTRLSKLIVDTIVSLKEFSPVNIIVPKTVPELIEVNLDPTHVVRELLPILHEEKRRAEMLQKLRSVRNALAGGGATDVSERVAQCAFDMLEGGIKKDREGAYV